MNILEMNDQDLQQLAVQTTYMALVAAFNQSPTDANIDALEAFEAAHPGVWNEIR